MMDSFTDSLTPLAFDLVRLIGLSDRFTAMAAAAGYAQVHRVDDLADWERRLPEFLKQRGPLFIDIEMQRGGSYAEDFERLYDTKYRDAFRDALAASK